VLTPDLIEDFRRDGAVRVRGAFTPDEVALVERGIENATWPSPASERSSPAATTTPAASSRTSATGNGYLSTSSSSATRGPPRSRGS
jgi:hypothetical protein